jgi:hypothetical protein
MSLISEALKKARQEAARQDSLRQGVPYAVGAVNPPSRRNPLLPLLAGLGAGCLLAGVLFGIAWIAGIGPFDKPAREAQVAQVPAAPQEATPAPTPVVTEIAPPAPTPLPVAPTPVPEERPQPVVATPPAPPVEQPVIRLEPHASPTPTPAPVEEERPAVLVPEPSPAPPTLQAQPAPPSRPAVPAPVIPGGLEEGKVYTGEVPVPGGGSLKLNGIAFSQDQPIVVLDGRVMGPGEVIQGFTVVEIQSDRVKLQGHGATVFVTTK